MLIDFLAHQKSGFGDGRVSFGMTIRVGEGNCLCLR